MFFRNVQKPVFLPKSPKMCVIETSKGSTFSFSPLKIGWEWDEREKKCSGKANKYFPRRQSPFLDVGK
jgi:hypothetical protein